MELPVRYVVSSLDELDGTFPLHVLTFACLFLPLPRFACVLSASLRLKRLFTERTMCRFVVLKQEKDKDKENKDNQEGEDGNGNDDVREGPLKDKLEKGFNDELLNIVLRIRMIESVCELFHPSFENLFKAFLILGAVSHPLRNVVIF